MNRSDSTTSPLGISIRTGPDTSTGPLGTTCTRVAVIAFPRGSQSAPLPGVRAVSGRPPPATSARDDITGPNGIHLEAITFASMPAHLSESSDCWTPASAECTSSRDPPSRKSFGADSHSGSRIIRPSTPAFHAQDGPAAGADLFHFCTGRRGNIGRVRHDDIERRVIHCRDPRSFADVDLDTGSRRVFPSATHRLRANVEGRCAGATHGGSRDRDETAAGAQIEDPPPRDQTGVMHHVHQQSGVLLRLIHVGSGRNSGLGIRGCHCWPFENPIRFAADHGLAG